MLSLGIYIQDHRLDWAELSPKGQILRLESLPLLNFKSESSKNLAIAEQLKKLQIKYQNQSVRFCFGLYQNRVSYFKKLFPFKEKFKLHKVLSFEIEEESLFQAKNVFFDTRLNPEPYKDKNHVLCFFNSKKSCA